MKLTENALEEQIKTDFANCDIKKNWIDEWNICHNKKEPTWENKAKEIQLKKHL